VPDVSGLEKRQRRRVQKNMEVEFCGYDGTHRGVSENFSIDGLSIRTDSILPLQSVVSITVHLPDGSISKLKGKVRRVHKVTHDIIAASRKTFKGEMGIEIIERDSSYIQFFMSLLSGIKL
jgi:hypothetical protein